MGKNPERKTSCALTAHTKTMATTDPARMEGTFQEARGGSSRQPGGSKGGGGLWRAAARKEQSAGPCRPSEVSNRPPRAVIKFLAAPGNYQPSTTPFCSAPNVKEQRGKDNSAPTKENGQGLEPTAGAAAALQCCGECV